MRALKKLKIYVLFFAYILLPLSTTRRYWHENFINFLNSTNPAHNNLGRTSYNPNDYKSGENFLNTDDRKSKLEGRRLDEFLKRFQPKKVLEIGPGSGFHTRQILDSKSLEQYTSLEVNSSFCRYLNDAMRSYPIKTVNINKDFKEVQLSEIDCDTIIAISSLHHMHDRTEFLTEALTSIPNLRSIFIFDPAHYLPRVIKLTRKLKRYWQTNGAFLDAAWSTHHFLTIGEFKKIKTRFPNVSIEYIPVPSNKFQRVSSFIMGVENKLGLTKRLPISRFFLTSLCVIIETSEQASTNIENQS